MMRKMMAKFLQLMLTVILVSALTCCTFGGYQNVILLNWEIALPADCTEVYAADTGASPHGDGLRYHVFACTDTECMEKLCGRSGEDAAQRAEAFLDELNIPQEQRPDYTACILRYERQEDSSELFLLWNEDAGMLYVVESFL